MSLHVLLAVLTALLGNEGEPSASIGPISIGQSVAEIQRSLGSGDPSRICEPGEAAADCDVALRFTDGRARVTVRFPANRGVARIDVDLERTAGATRLPRRYGSIANWTFVGERIGSPLPSALPGWQTAEYRPGTNCHADFEIPDISAIADCAPGTARPAHVSVFEH